MLRLIVHGGAWSIPDEHVNAHLEGVQMAIETVWPRLERGISALDAVQAAVEVLEAHPAFDAGRGSFLNAAGAIEMDALIMDGETLAVGVVAGLQHVLHPVAVARAVMELTDHCLLIGEGATTFARHLGFEQLPEEALLVGRELEYFQTITRQPGFKPHDPFKPLPSDTVGAVAMDHLGRIAAATSTGGTPRKMPGRVGDAPIPGAGGFADKNRGAVSATGWGEAILKVQLSRMACDFMASMPAQAAVREALGVMFERTGGWGGLVGIDTKGQYGMTHTTDRMAWACMDQQIRFGITV